MKKLLLLISILLLIRGTTKKENISMSKNTPRGIRNNNPLNIEKGENWQGSIKGNDPRFLTFSDPKYGFRAGAKLLKNYQKFYGLDTLHKIINRYAPDFENDTNSYAHHIASAIGIGVHDTIVLNDNNLLPILKAMAKHENGINPYDDQIIKDGILLS